MERAELTAVATTEQPVLDPDAEIAVAEVAEVAAADATAARAARIRAATLAKHELRWWNRLWYRFEETVSRLSTRNNFWHRICSRIWLPLAFRSGIKIQKGDIGTFSAVLPFRKFNRNWYNAMAGGALLGNAEIAGGMYVFRKCGTDYTVVCKQLCYDFLRPCHGPAVYRIEPQQPIEELVAVGGEFNIKIDMEVVQMVQAKTGRERRVGRCTAQFHVAPKARHRAVKHRRKGR